MHGMQDASEKSLVVNGARRAWPEHQAASLSVRALLTVLGYPETAFIAVALNHQCVPRQAYAETAVRPGDAVEILAPMAGG